VALTDTLGTFCDEQGPFQLAVPPGTYAVAVTLVGYAELREEVREPYHPEDTDPDIGFRGARDF